jgi:hypothetical protein
MQLKSTLRAILLGVVITGVASPALAKAFPDPAPVTRLTSVGPGDPLLDDIARLSFPSRASRSNELLSHTVERTSTYYDRIPDMNGDGHLDVLMQTRSYEMFDDSSAPGDSFYSLKLEVLDGTKGTTLWEKYMAGYDRSFHPSLAKVGRAGRNGLHIFEYDERSYPATVTVIALRGSGKEAWRRTIPEQRSLTLDHLNAAPGRATDVLVGYLVRQTQIPSGGETVMSSASALIIDGADGEVIRHPAVEARIGRRANPHPAPDLNGDGLDDYVFVDEWNAYGLLTQGEGHVVARSGLDGDELWRSEPVLTGHTSWVSPAGDLDGNQRADLIVESELGYRYGSEYGPESDAPLHALEGETGRVLWSESGWLFDDLGDINGDGTAEVMTATPVNEEGRRGVRVTARAVNGSVTYTSFLRIEDAPLHAEMYAGLFRPGDLDGDGHPDLLAKQTAYWGKQKSSQAVTVSGRTGRTATAPDGALPAYASFSTGRDDLLVQERIGDHVVEIHAPWRKGSLEAFDGRITATGLGEYPNSSVQGGNFYADSCPGLLVTFESTFEYGGPSAALMIDPTSGKVRWAHGRAGGVTLSTKRSLTTGCG